MADFTSGKNWSDFYSGILPPSTPAPAQPAVNWDQFYSGIIPAAPSAPSVVSPNLTAEERALLQQQMQQSQTLQAGYNPNGTPKIRPSWTIPAAPSVITPNTPASGWNRIDQAGYNATKRPGTWLAQSRMNAQALMRQMAALQGGMPMAPAAVPAAPATGGLAALITGKGTPRAKSNGGLAAVLAAPPNPYQTPEHLQSQGYKDAYKSSSGNVGGVSQHGRFYDIDRNQWVDTTKKSNSPSGERTYAMGAS